MNHQYLSAMEKNLSRGDHLLLSGIFSPKVVTIPPSDANRFLYAGEDGEIRIYGTHYPEIGEPYDIYNSSYDAGLSFKTIPITDRVFGPADRNPESGRYIGLYPSRYEPKQKGAWAYISEFGPDSTDYRAVKLSDEERHFNNKSPQYIEQYRRWFVLGESAFPYPPNGEKHVYVYTSDDDGETWREAKLPHAPKFEVAPPHKGVRWQEYSCEPTIALCPDGRILMFVRTSQDRHYMHISYDGGLSWSDPEPSPFYGTITMPHLYRLSNGSIVFFWCNTKPMPELDHSKTVPSLGQDEQSGLWEDVFTNRDACHLAISDDGGKSWHGFRELYLNDVRNRCDFRSIGRIGTHDKSVHQGEILELPENKLLVSFGQCEVARRAVILDLDWLREAERHEDFRDGMTRLSTHMYLESNLGGYKGFSGHCAYNRTHGAKLIPDPDGSFREVLAVCREDDPRLVYPKQGVVWNFPASKRGELSLELMVRASGIAVTLLDKWMNPSDEEAKNEGFISVSTDDLALLPNEWHIVSMKYDTDAGSAELWLDGAFARRLTTHGAPEHGLSYLHLQTLAESADYLGTLLRRFDQKSEGRP